MVRKLIPNLRVYLKNVCPIATLYLCFFVLAGLVDKVSVDCFLWTFMLVIQKT
jgi:hypothetical protein